MTYPRYIRILAIMLGALLTGILLPSSGTPQSSDRLLRMAIWMPAFTSHNPNDARAAVHVWVEKWGKKSGFFKQAEAVAFDDFSTLYKYMENNNADVMMLPVEEYLMIANKYRLDADFTVGRGGEPGDIYVLMVHRDGGVKTLEDLKDRHIIITSEHNHRNAVVWLNSLLADKGLPPAETFCRLSEAQAKPAKQILPVYFGQADACVVSLFEFQTMAELNPQVGHNLHALATSPRLISIVFSFNMNMAEARRSILEQSLALVHEDEDFKQVLTLHKVDRLMRIPPALLEATKKMYMNFAGNAAVLGEDSQSGEDKP